jgi:SAM-dependent methyltransferase
MADSAYSLELSEVELQRYALMAAAAREAEADLWQLAGLTYGAGVGDIGCGPGAMFPAIVDSVGETGRVVGVDGDANAVSAATALVTANGWTNATAQVGPADDTGLQPGSFDAVMMRHVLAHNGPKEQLIVDHLATLVRPGGSVYLVDIDASGMRMRPTDPDVEDLSSAYRRFHAAKGNDLEVGLRLRELLTSAGLDVVAYRGWYNIMQPPPGVRPPAWAARDAMIAAGIATAADVVRWEAAFDRLGERRPTIYASLFGAVGRRAA